MDKILFISREYFPLSNANTNCLENILDILKKNYDVDVITAKRSIISKKEENIKGINIKRYNIPTENLIYLRNSIIDYISTKKIPKIILNPIRRMLLKSLLPLQPYFEENGYYYPKSWEKNLSKEIAANIDLSQYKWVLAIGFPYDNVQVAYELKQRFEKIKFGIIEFDLYTNNPVTILNDSEEKYNARLEKENNWYSFVDKLFLTSEVQNILLNNPKINIIEEKIKTIEMPVLKDVSKQKPTRGILHKKKGSINLVYTGMFYESIRRPEFMLDTLISLFSQIPNLTLHIIGFGCNDVLYEYRDKYSNNIYIYGKKHKEFCQNALLEADILLNVGNKTSSQAPSKIIEYIGTGKPILNFFSINDDLCVKILEQYPYALSIKENDPINTEILKSFITKEINNQNLNLDYMDLYKKYKPEIVVETIIKGLKEEEGKDI